MFRPITIAVSIWAVVTALTLAILYANLSALEVALHFPGAISDFLLVRVPFFALPCALTAGLVFAAAASPRPSLRTAAVTTFGALLIMAVCMTLAGMLLRAAAMPVYRGHELKIVLLLALALVAAFTLPPVLLTPGKRVIWRLWWQPILTLIIFGVLMVATGALLPGGIPEQIARWAESMGAHYYTVLNFTGPALQVSGATLAASWLGLAWVRAHDRHGRADIFR